MAEEAWSVSGRKEVKSKTDVNIPICAVCKLDGKSIPAVGMCESCPDDLCEECFTIHCKPKPSRDHVLRRSVFVVAGDGTQKWGDISKCKFHENKMIEYYCEDHDALGCSQCFVTKHRLCRRVIVIADVASGTQNSNEFQRMEAGLRYIEREIRRYKPVLKNAREVILKSRKEFSTQVEEYGNRLKGFIEQFIEKQKSEINALAEQDLKKVTEIGQYFGQCETNFATYNDFIESHKQCGKPELLFVAMKQESKIINAKQREIQRVIETSKVGKYTFEPREAVSKSLQMELQQVHVRSFRSMTMYGLFPGSNVPGSV